MSKITKCCILSILLMISVLVIGCRQIKESGPWAAEKSGRSLENVREGAKRIDKTVETMSPPEAVSSVKGETHNIIYEADVAENAMSDMIDCISRLEEELQTAREELESSDRAWYSWVQRICFMSIVVIAGVAIWSGRVKIAAIAIIPAVGWAGAYFINEIWEWLPWIIGASIIAALIWFGRESKFGDYVKDKLIDTVEYVKGRLTREADEQLFGKDKLSGEVGQIQGEAVTAEVRKTKKEKAKK
jgi:hypothetical protein